MSTNESRVNRTCRRQTLSAERRESDRQRALSAVNRMATRIFKEKKKTTKPSLSFDYQGCALRKIKGSPVLLTRETLGAQDVIYMKN